jgi:hypothetical protein
MTTLVLFMDTLSSLAVAVVKIYGVTYNVLLYKHPVTDTCVAAATNMFRETESVSWNARPLISLVP